MEALTAPRGLIVDLVTPLRRDGSLDGSGLRRLLERVTPYAEAVLLASPNAGEGRDLVPEMKVAILEEAVLAMGQTPVPIFMWVTQESEDQTRETTFALKETLEKCGYPGDLFWVDTPLLYHSNRGLPALYDAFCSAVDGPFVLHNDPELIKGLGKPLKRNNVRTAILKELITLKEITGLIFSGSLDRAHNYQRACRQRPHFRIYDGDEAHFLDHPSMGGAVSIGANLAPRAWGKITRSSLQLSAHKKHYPDHLQQIWESGDYLRDLRDIYMKAPVAVIKDMLAEMGVIETPFSTSPLEDAEPFRVRLRELMTRFGDFRL